MAQSNHAASVFEHKFGDRPRVKKWKQQTKDGFGTCIVLAASLEQIEAVLSTLFNGPIKGWVVDPDYVIRVTHEVASFIKNKDITFMPESADDKTIAFTRVEKTCAFVFGTKEEMSLYLGDLPLY